VPKVVSQSKIIAILGNNTHNCKGEFENTIKYNYSFYGMRKPLIARRSPALIDHTTNLLH
jgi:hypothetical protein